MARTSSQPLPKLLDRKLYKTGQTRGADDDEIYQNRVSRQSTVIIPYTSWKICKEPAPGEKYENGFIVLISPERYFTTPDIDAHLKAEGLELGRNLLVFYEKREQWDTYNPERKSWKPASQRTGNLGGQYVARVSATTSTEEGKKINHGFTTTSMKGAGIRVYEYASAAATARCRRQLEALFWLCADADSVALLNGMTAQARDNRKKTVLAECEAMGLLDVARLKAARVVNDKGMTICPLCLDVLQSDGFFNRMEQAEGREVHDLTVTKLSLFHINELRTGAFNHAPYNLGWGHHHCNVVVKDSGIVETLKWLKTVIDRNVTEGLLSS